MKNRNLLMILICIFMLIIPLGMACKQRYDLFEDVMIYDIIESEGNGSDCMLYLYKGEVLNQSGWMNKSGLAYWYNASTLPQDTYSATIECNLSASQFRGECKFKVLEESKLIIGILILAPLILGLFLLIGAASMSDEHIALRISLFLFSVITFFVSLHFGVVALIKFPELENLVGTTTYWMGWVFAVIVTYFIIYAFYKLVHKAAQKKKERLHY